MSEIIIPIVLGVIVCGLIVRAAILAFWPGSAVGSFVEVEFEFLDTPGSASPECGDSHADTGAD